MRQDLALLSMSENQDSKGGHTMVAVEEASGPWQQFTGEGTMQSSRERYELYGLGRGRGRGQAAPLALGAAGALLAAAVATVPVMFFYGVARDAKKSQRLVKFSGYTMATLGALGIVGGLVAGATAGAAASGT